MRHGALCKAVDAGLQVKCLTIGWEKHQMATSMYHHGGKAIIRTGPFVTAADYDCM